MSEVCELLGSSLELYAEGELRDSRALRRVRRHLDGCPRCRRVLREHDALTRRIFREYASGRGEERAWGTLAGSDRHLLASSDGSGRRARRREERILERVEALADRRRAPANRGRRAVRFAALAATLLLGFLVPALVLRIRSPGSGGGDGSELVRRAEVSVARRAAAPAKGPNALPPLGEIRWLRQSDVDLRDVAAPGQRARPGTMWLYGPARPDDVAVAGGAARQSFSVSFDDGAASLALEVHVAGGPVPPEIGGVLLIPEEILLGAGNGSDLAVVDSLIYEVIPRQLVEIPPLPSWAVRAGSPERRSGPPPRYRVVPVSQPGLRHAPAMRHEGLEVLRWDLPRPSSGSSRTHPWTVGGPLELSDTRS